MKILGSDIRVGNIIEYKNDLWKCLKNQTSNRGNLRSHNQVELKSITKGTKLNERFRADETVEKASLEEKKFQFLYSANDEFFFMDSENFEQISINKTLVENCEKLLKENLEVIIEFYQEKPLSVILPRSVEYEILETDSVVRGQTASSSFKPALIRDFGEVEKLQVSKKGPGDFVTNSDKRTEKIIINELSLARPDYSFLAEESGSSGKSNEFRWIIDPIDGTTNFLHGIPYFAISIGLEKNKEIICGMIFNPITNEMFYAEKGKGAYLNNSRIRVSSRKNIDECVLLTGGPILSYKNKEIFFKEYESVSRRVAATRKFGSSALDLAYLASGRCDAVWERNLNYWDVAAGIVIVKEAGGTVTDFKGGDKYIEDGNLLATNSKIDKDLIALLA